MADVFPPYVFSAKFDLRYLFSCIVLFDVQYWMERGKKKQSVTLNVTRNTAKRRKKSKRGAVARPAFHQRNRKQVRFTIFCRHLSQTCPKRLRGWLHPALKRASIGKIYTWGASCANTSHHEHTSRLRFFFILCKKLYYSSVYTMKRTSKHVE